jgi:DNA-binding MurR/RpiR family transcriptional regulator
MGGSGVMADELHQRLHRLGLMSWAWTDVHQALTSVAHCGPGDVVICVSHTGRTREAIECLQRAAESGAYAVALTSHSSSPLAQAADVVLRTTSGQVAIRPDALAARHSQLYVIDVLLIVVMQRMRNDIEAILTKTANAVSDHQVDPHRRAHRGDQGPSGKSASR